MADLTEVPDDKLSARIHALIFNGITRASSSAADDRDWIRLSERERIAEAVYAELRAGNIEFRLGGLALLAEAVETEAERAEARRLNGPMVARLRKCAADTSANWDGKITIYPPEARELVALIDASADGEADHA